VLGYLGSIGWEVFVPNLRADFGRGSTPPIEKLRFTDLTALAGEALDAIGRDAVVFGHGVGGLVALKLSAHRRVKASVAYAPLVPGFRTPLAGGFANRIAMMWSRPIKPPRGRVLFELIADSDPFTRDGLINAMVPDSGALVSDVMNGAIEFVAADKAAPRLVVAGDSDIFAPLPQTFWHRSMFVKPQDREVVCHASAWDIDYVDDLRIKMCIEQKSEDFSTIHHELGHNFYQRAYDTQPPLFRNSANDGFHEAIGDTIALSVTPEYLKQIGLLENVPPESADIGILMDKALEKVAFLPFGLLIDKWRWEVFSGKITPADYNRAWWEMREKYQGVKPPVERSEEDFDPGAKYHVAANVPYARYFLADILQFQFHRALCRESGYKGPLHRCSIYNNKVAGARLNKMLEMGQSRPWPEALEVMTGEKQMDATAILDYFAPLKKWLDEQNAKDGAKLDW